MPSNLITPPDIIHSNESILIINAIDSSIELLTLWLRSVPENYDVHLYHSEMKESTWVLELANWIPILLVEQNHIKYCLPDLQAIFHRRTHAVHYFGPGTKYPELVNY